MPTVRLWDEAANIPLLISYIGGFITVDQVIMGDIFPEKCTAKTHAVNRTFLVFLHSVEDKIKSHTTQRNTEFAGVEFYTSKKFIKYASYVTRRSNLVCLAIGVIPLRGWKHLTIEFDLNGSNYMHSELTPLEKKQWPSQQTVVICTCHIYSSIQTCQLSWNSSTICVLWLW